MTTSPHRQAIVVFGIVIPFALLGLVVGLTYFGHSKLKENHEKKLADLERYNRAKSQVAELDAFLTANGRREQATHWNEKLGKDVVESLSETLDKILAKHEPETLRQTEMGRLPGNGGLGAKTEHPYSKMQLRFEGGFKPMQLLLAELEAEMPQLVLESIQVAPKASSDNESRTLQFSLVYHCWEMAGTTAGPKK